MAVVPYRLTAQELPIAAKGLKAFDRVLLSGVVYTARDAAHQRISRAIARGEPLPFPLQGSTIYYVGPTPTKPGKAIGSCGPTTSGRMDIYTPELMDLGLACTIGKGPRDQGVINAIVRNGGLYLCALGGAGALAAKSIMDCRVVAYEDLGCESIKRLILKDFPLIVGIDSEGNHVFA